MSNQVMTKNPTGSGNWDTCTGFGTTIPWSNISEPGCYVCNWSGHLLRVPEDAVKPGRSPVLDMRAKEPLFVTKLSEDPFITLTKARIVASDLDQDVNF